MRVAIHWFRRDLRLADNAALTAAAESDRLLPLWIDDPEGEEAGGVGAAGALWLDHSLAALDHRLAQAGSRLVRRSGVAVERLAELVAEFGVAVVHAQRSHEPALQARDREVAQRLAALGVELRLHDGGLLIDPERLLTGGGRAYRVFTPFWRAAVQVWRLPDGQPAPALPPLPEGIPRVEPASAVCEAPWQRRVIGHWQPGEAGALAALERFAENCADYAGRRDLPGDSEGVSRLSPHLHFGEVAPARVVHTVVAAAGEAAEPFLRQLGWREFAAYLLHHYPHTVEQPLDGRFAAMPWRDDGDPLLAAWQQGRTGFPLVDAGMRQLWQTGWMHNRVRMVAASLLVKNLRLPWQLGAAWFRETLVDFDLANNTLGWQWVAGCGADAAPYWRIFNPQRQGERFDPQAVYLNQWLPAPVVGRHPHAARPDAVVDYAASRAEALEIWNRLKEAGDGAQD